MAKDDNNIKQFIAVDIEKYHKGLLSSAEMHAMEKAAMDDPFLADALEGYATAGVDARADIAELKKKLNEKTGSGRVVPLASSPRRYFQLLRVAVILAFIAGATLLIYQLGFNNNSNKDIAQAKKEPVETKTAFDSVSAPANQPESSKITDKGLASTETKPNVNVNQPEALKPPPSPPKGADDKPAEEKTVESALAKPTDGSVTRSFEPAPPVITSATGAGEKSNKPGAEDKVIAKGVTREVGDLKFKEKDNDGVSDEEKKKDQAPFSRKVAGKIQKQENPAMGANNNANTFRGQVIGNNNVGVPFANVTNQTDNAGTYTNASGYFNLTYPDSVLNVQVKSIGFENRNAQLRNDVPTNQVVLQEDRSNLSEVVVNKQRINAAARNRDNNLKLDEPEPADGWEKYDAYLLNNLNMPEDAKERQKTNAAVQLSFEVNKNGDPTNIKVEKSLCRDCDKEAIRLLKEGPKWKRSAKKSRTTITVPFQ